MNIRNLVLPPLDNNCYILEKEDEIIVIDPASNFDEITKDLDLEKIVGVLVTHYHYDHIGALDDFKKYKIPVFDYSNLNDYNKIGKFDFFAIKTPGHKSDCITYYFKEDNSMFTGDFLFKENIGLRYSRWGSYSQMISSINNIKKYPESNVYPGHGESTTLGDKKKYNPYF